MIWEDVTVLFLEKHREQMRKKPDQSKKKTAWQYRMSRMTLLGAVFCIAIYVSCGKVQAARTPVEGKPGAAFGTEDETDSIPDADILSDYSDSNVTYGLEPTADQTVITSNVIYDSAKQRYIYVTDFGRVESSVVDGMIVTDSVSLAAESGVPVMLYKNGERLEQSDLTDIQDSGYYVLQYNDNGGIPQTILEFTIVPQLTGMVDRYSLPTGFAVTTASFNGAELPASTEVNMEKEGSYRITYECKRTGVLYELDVDIDHTPPQLALEAVKDGVARGPVDISDLEEGAKVYMTLDGSQYNYREKLTRSGKYEIWVYDAAGNMSKYEFTIMIYLDGSGYAFFALFLLLILGVIMYMMIEKKRLRVR